ncbi:MAG: DMT family transporter [Rhodobacteraceae bacterium]|nr:DMT family transporter [Paracoccaceae bacterium]
MEPTSHPLKAAVFMLGAMISFSLMAIAGRELSSTLDTFEIMTYRSLIGVIIVLGVARWQGLLGKINRNRLGLHFFRNVLHFTGQNLWFYALIYIPLSQLFAFEFTNPLWVALLAPFFLGEKMTSTRLLAFLLGFIGILIVARPQSSDISPATAAAALCALSFAGTNILTKKLTRTESTINILFWLVSLQALFGLIFTLYDGSITVPTGVNLIWVALVGLCGLTAHYCITTALTLAPVTVVAPLDFLRLPLIAVVGWLLYSEPLEIAVFFGAALVIAANWMNIRAEQRPRQK